MNQTIKSQISKICQEAKIKWPQALPIALLRIRDLNLQLQATTKMTLQNRMALDILLIKEHGVCGYLKDRVDHCCVHIPNVTADIEHYISQLTKVEQEAEKEREYIEQSWVGALFNSLGLHLTGWIRSLIQTVITMLIVILMIYLMYLCIRKK